MIRIRTCLKYNFGSECINDRVRIDDFVSYDLLWFLLGLEFAKTISISNDMNLFKLTIANENIFAFSSLKFNASC